MPRIIKDTEQMKALDTVTEDLEIIAVLNKMIDAKNPAFTLTITTASDVPSEGQEDEAADELAAEAVLEDDAEAAKKKKKPKGGKRDGGALSAAISPKVASKIQQALVIQRSALVKEILGLTVKYRIELSADERKLLKE